MFFHGPSWELGSQETGKLSPVSTQAGRQRPVTAIAVRIEERYRQGHGGSVVQPDTSSPRLPDLKNY